MTSWLVIERPTVKLYRPGYRRLKRLMDLTFCLVLLPFFAVALMVITLLIRLESPGPVLFVQERVGKGGRRFKMIKFRTMHHNVARDHHRTFMKAFVRGEVQINEAQTNGANGVFKPFDQSQVTKVGRLLRATSLDELPQVINVLRGEMSFVGPRPNVAWEVEEYKGWHKERLEVLPGITGLAQVRGRSGIFFDQIIRYDIEYVHKRSLWLDLKIIGWTFTTVFKRTGAH